MRKTDSIDCIIWSQFKNGDRKSFSLIYQQHISDLISYGRKICSDEEVLKDVIQDLFVELWHSRTNLASLDSIKFYLLKSLRYKLIRTEKRSFSQQKVSILFTQTGEKDFDNSVEARIVDREISDSYTSMLHRAITSLTKRQQEVIQLRFYQGFSHEQIADLMHVNYQSVSNLLFSALTRIKEKIKAPVFATVFISFLVLYI